MAYVKRRWRDLKIKRVRYSIKRSTCGLSSGTKRQRPTTGSRILFYRFIVDTIHGYFGHSKIGYEDHDHRKTVYKAKGREERAHVLYIIKGHGVQKQEWNPVNLALLHHPHHQLYSSALSLLFPPSPIFGLCTLLHQSHSVWSLAVTPVHHIAESWGHISGIPRAALAIKASAAFTQSATPLIRGNHSHSGWRRCGTEQFATTFTDFLL